MDINKPLFLKRGWGDFIHTEQYLHNFRGRSKVENYAPPHPNLLPPGEKGLFIILSLEGRALHNPEILRQAQDDTLKIPSFVMLSLSKHLAFGFFRLTQRSP
jgi:hypothetical protein